MSVSSVPLLPSRACSRTPPKPATLAPSPSTPVVPFDANPSLVRHLLFSHRSDYRSTSTSTTTTSRAISPLAIDRVHQTAIAAVMIPSDPTPEPQRRASSRCTRAKAKNPSTIRHTTIMRTASTIRKCRRPCPAAQSSRSTRRIITCDRGRRTCIQPD